MTAKQKKELIKLIHNEVNNGKIVICTIDGFFNADAKEFIEQTADGILYDLNRDEQTILALSKLHIRWVNDFAVACTIRALKDKINELNVEVADLLELLTQKSIETNKLNNKP